jgi:hypothetical protein
MNKRQVISSLNNIAEELDNNGLYVEASTITNVMKKVAQEYQTPVRDNLTKKIQVSMGEVENLHRVIGLLEEKNLRTESDISKYDLESKIDAARRTLKLTLQKMMLQPSTIDLEYPMKYYSPNSLPELRDYISKFYKKESQNYSSNNSMKQYLSLLANFTNSAVRALNNLASSPAGDRSFAADSTFEEPTE